MKKSKKTALLAAVAAFTLLFSGCFPSSSQTETGTKTDEEPTDLSLDFTRLYGEPETLTRNMIPERYEDKVSDSILISAEVIAPDNIEFGSVTAQEAVYPSYEDQQELVDLFMQDEIVNEEHNQKEDGDGFFDGYDSSSTEALWFNNSGLTYYRSASPEDGPTTFDYYTYCYGNHLTNAYSARLNEFFTLEELDGIDKAWAISLVKEKIDIISAKTGLEYEQEPEVYCFESDGAREFYKTAYMYGYDPEDFSFSEENNAYFVYFRTVLFGMPVTGDDWVFSESSNSAREAYAYGIVDKDGLVEFNATGGSIPVYGQPAAENLYNVDVVKKALYDQYGDDELKAMNVVTDIYLQYVSESKQDGYYVYRPYWVCYVGHFDKESFSEEEVLKQNPYLVLYVSALSGELLSTSDIETMDREYF